jgi:hypothetical protein
MAVLVIHTEQEDYPFKFLSPERYDVQGALELVSEMYEHVAQREGPWDIMTIHELIMSTIGVFRKERYARMILHGDYDDEEISLDIHGDQLCTYFNELSENEGLSLGDFLDRICDETEGFTSLMGTYVQNYYHDVRYALGRMGLVYFDVGEPIRSYPFEQRAKHAPISDYLRNAVVKEVW